MKSVILSSVLLSTIAGCGVLIAPQGAKPEGHETTAVSRPVTTPLAASVPASLPEAPKPTSTPAYVGPQTALTLELASKEKIAALCSSDEKFRKVLEETEASDANQEVNQFAEVIAHHVTDKAAWERHLRTQRQTKGMLRDYLILCAVGLDAPGATARNFVKFWLEKQPPADAKNLQPEDNWKRILPLWLDPSSQEAGKNICHTMTTEESKGLVWLGCGPEMIVKRDRELKIETSPWVMDDIVRGAKEPILDSDGYRYVRLKTMLDEDHDNHAAAEKKYNGMKVRTVGEVGTVFGGKSGQVSIFQPGSGGGTTVCSVGAKGEEELAKLKRGRAIAIRGKVEFGGRGLKDCEILH